MKVLLLFVSITIPGLVCASSTLKMGQTLEKTLETLGKPLGTIELRDKMLLLYPQGEVTLKEGKITHLDLMSDEAFKEDQGRLQREREEWVIQKEREAAKRIEEGKKLKAYKMESSAFAALPAKDRVDYWRSFQIRFPEIAVSKQIAGALEGYESELKELRAQQRIAQLEARVARAEKEAALARQEAAQAQNEAKAARADKNYGLRYYTDPVVDRRYIYRPPTVTIYTNGNSNGKKDHRNTHKKQQQGTAERVDQILNTYHSLRKGTNTN